MKNNVYLDQYSVDGVPPGPAGSEKVAVTFTYDINGILEVKTKIVSTGKEASMTVDKSPSRMSSTDRTAARERLDREMPGGAGAMKASPSPQATNDGAALLTAARAKLAGLRGEDALKLSDLITSLEKATASGDTESAARLDLELTELLFELD